MLFPFGWIGIRLCNPATLRVDNWERREREICRTLLDLKAIRMYLNDPNFELITPVKYRTTAVVRWRTLS